MPAFAQPQTQPQQEQPQDRSASGLTQAGRARAGDLDSSRVPPGVRDALSRPGQPLDAETRTFMEPRFGHDFSRVRVHADAEANRATRLMSARAFAVGQDVFFAGGEYAPDTARGRRLLAHELAHVVQEPGGGTLRMQKAGDDKDAGANKDAAKSDPPKDDKDADKGKDAAAAAQPSPLRLVFYQQNSGDSPSFKAHAETIASSLGALKLPYSGCKADAKSVGSIACAREENVLIRAANYAKCLKQNVEQVHVVGHVPKGGPACLSGGLDAESAKLYVPTAKVVVHGCQGVSRFGSGTASVLKQLPNASVYVHKASAEAGGPLDFYKVTTTPGSADPQTITTSIPNVTNEGIGFSPAVVKQWAGEQLNTLKQAAKNKQQSTLDNIMQWLTLPIFASNETAVFADAIINDKSGEVPQNFVDAAKAFKTKWQASQAPAAP